jgi:transposase
MNFMERFPSAHRADRDPFLDESLLGFVNRRLSSTVFRRILRVMSTVGLPQQPETLPTIAFSDEQAKRLADILECDIAHLRQRTYLTVSWRGGRTAAIDFFGTKVRKNYRECAIRRVSPRALSAELYHRAVWDLRPFSFDPVTKEVLLDTCPVCRKKLGWKNTHAPQHCDKCIDERGLANVDLRDYPQPLVEVDDRRALDFVTGLVDPDPKIRSEARRLLPPAWQAFSNDEIFETVIAMTTGLRKDPSAGHLALGRGRTLDEFASLTPELLALGGRAIIGGDKGFAAVAARYRVDAGKRSSRAYGSEKELGQLGRLTSDEGLSSELRELLGALIEADMAQNGNFHRIMKHKVDGRDFLPLYRLAREFGINKHHVERLAKSGHLRTLRVEAAGRSPVQMSRSDLLPLVEELKDATSVFGASKRLGVPRPVLQSLADRGLVFRLTSAVVGFLEGGEGYSIKSIEEFHDRLWSKAKPKGSRSTVSLPYAARSLGSETELPWAAIISAIAAGDVEVFAGGDKRGAIRQSLVVADVDAFLVGVRKHMRQDNISTDKWISASTAAEILKVSDPLFYRLVAKRPDVLKAENDGNRPYRRTDVDVAVKKYVFTAEVAEMAMEPLCNVRSFLKGLGIDPVIALEANKDFAYPRGSVVPLIESIVRQRQTWLAELPKKSEDARVQFIRAVMCDGRKPRLVAEDLGISFGQANYWLTVWKATGQAAAKKSHPTRRVEFDDHVDFVRDLLRSNPDVTLQQVTDRLRARGWKCSVQKVRDNLSRYQIVLRSVVEARKKNGQDKNRGVRASDG